jgi:hypothetical protein
MQSGEEIGRRGGIPFTYRKATTRNIPEKSPSSAVVWEGFARRKCFYVRRACFELQQQQGEEGRITRGERDFERHGRCSRLR